MRKHVLGVMLVLASAGTLKAQGNPLDPDTVQVLRGFAINGRMATRGAVKRTADGRVTNDGSGQPTWVEYDDAGYKYDVVPPAFKQDPTLVVSSPDQFCFAAYEESQAAKRAECLATYGTKRSILSNGTTAHVYPVSTNERVIALETDFFTLDLGEEGANPGCTFNQNALATGTNADSARASTFISCKPKSMGVNGELRVWAPIVGAEIEWVNQAVYRKTHTDQEGYFYVTYTPRVNEYSNFDISGIISFAGFEPRSPSARRFFVSTSAVTGYIFEPGQAYIGLQPVPNYSADPQIASGTLFANFPIEAAVLTLSMRMVQPKGTVPSVELLGYQGVTRYNDQAVAGDIGLLSSIVTPELRDTEIYVYRVSDGKLVGSRWGMFDSEIASTGGTDIAGCDGKACLVPSVLMRGPASLYTNRVPARFNPAVNIPPLVDSSGKVIKPGQFGVELNYNHGLSGGQIPFLHEGDQVKVIAINRATGYMGSKLMTMKMVSSERGRNMTFVHAGSGSRELNLAPPNLKLTVTRQTTIHQGATRSKDPVTYVIGFEGSGLDTDEIIKVDTEWYDSDGSPLPEDLPGFTGRLAMTLPTGAGDLEAVSIDGGAVRLGGTNVAQQPGLDARQDIPPGEDRSGFFSIKPGKKDVVVRLPERDIGRGHFYVHVDAQPLTRNVDFSGSPPPAGPSFSISQVCYYSTCNVDGTGCVGAQSRWTCTIRPPEDRGAGAGALAQRPANFVPFLVPRYDKDATAAARSQQGSTEAKPVYEWFYRPEMQFSVFSLEVKNLELRDSDGTSRDVLPLQQPVSLYSADNLVRATYRLDKPDTAALTGLGGPRKLVFAIGGETTEVEYGGEDDNVAAVSDPRVSGKMSPHDFLALRLLQGGDEGNVLWEYAFQDIRAYLTDDKGNPIRNVAKGEPSHAKAKLQPANAELLAQVRWTLIHADEGVKFEIGESTGLITVPKESDDGFVVIEAKANPQLFTRVRLRVGCECQTCDKPGGCMLRLGSVDLTFSLGGAAEGASGGMLYVKSDTLADDAYKRKSVLISTMDVLTHSVGDKDGLQQVSAPGAFVQIEDLEPKGYEFRFYPPSVRSPEKNPNTKLYDVTLPDASNPLVGAFAVWRITDPGEDQAGAKRLRVTEIRDDGALTRVHDYVYAADGTWTLRQGEGESNESRQQLVRQGRRVVRVTVGDDTNGTASVVERTYQPFAWGEEIVEEVQDPDPDGAQLKTVTTYYENEDETGSYKQVKSRVEPDGSWVRYSYDDHRRVLTETRPWLDAPADPVTASDADSRVVQYSYAPLDPLDIANTLEGSTEQSQGFSTPRVVAERVQGKLTSLSYASVRQTGDSLVEIEERCPTPSSSFGDGSCLRTETRYYAEDFESIASGKVRTVSYSDGRMDSYTYERGVWTGSAFTTGDGSAMRTTVTHGTVGSPAGVPYKTRREVSIVDDLGRAVRDESYVYDGGYALVSWAAREYDAEGHLKRTTHSTGEEERATWGCCAEDTTTDSRGITTTYDRDKLQRVRSATRAGVTTTYTYDGQGRELTTTRSGGGASLTTSRQYDGAGRMKLSRDEAGLDTTYAYEAGGRVTTVTRPGGFVEVTTRGLDGQQRSVTGNTVVPQYLTYDVRGDGTRVTEVHTGSAESPVFERTITDMLGRAVRTERPGFGGTLEVTVQTYDARGMLAHTTTTGSAPVVYEYDELGNAIRSGLDVNANGRLDVASMDRISENETRAVSVGGSYWQETTQRIYPEDNGGTPKVAGVTRSRLTGFSGGMVSDQVSIDLNGNETRSAVLINPSSATETRVIDTPDSTINAVSVTTQGRLVSTTSPTGVTTTYGYDGLGRRNAVTDARTGTSTTHYDAAGRVDYVQDAAGNKTSFGYEDATGRKNRETNALGKHSHFAYDARGQLIRTWGDVPYPVQYVYDAYGRRTEMHTYREDAGWSSSTWPQGASGDVTKWHYEESTGLLQSKEDAAGKAVTYAYGAAGRLKTRTWARQKQGGGPLLTKYDYDSDTGELVGVDYNDNTPDVTYVYDRLGRQKTVTDGTGSRTFAYDPTTLQLQTETMAGITPAVLTRYYDPAGVKGRPVGMTLGAGYTVGWGYSTSGQLQSVSWTANGTSDVATYARAPGSDLLAGYATQSGFATTYAYEPKRDLKTQVRNKWGSTVVSQYDNAYDAIGRRISVKNSGTAFVSAAFTKWGYDERDQVTSGDRYLGNSSVDLSNPVNAEQRAFQYDPIGNRESSTAAGVQTVYSANELNQYGAVGSATLNYDQDGNLLNDGTKVLTFNAENQLNSVTMPGVSLSTYEYDYIGRRVRKRVDVLDGSGSDYVVSWVYSGWNKIEERKTVGGVTSVKNFVWALDVSQFIDRAGGVGGLLAVVDQSGAASQFTYDGNGNVSELISAPTGNVRAHYEFDAFGNSVLASGAAALENCYRFSTKYQDDETGWYYYGHRYYAPSVGRWLSLDPIAENGGLNLYSFVRNRPTSAVDLTGLALYAFDGTGNDKDDPSRMPTHVAALYEMYTKEKWYMYGLGTRDYPTLGNLAGLGAALRIDQMWSLFEASYKAGDREIDIVGFSRGAATAREFANRIYDKYPCAKIRFLGLFDTVAQIGAPDIGNSNSGVRLDIPPNVEYVAHAIARNERRTLFPLTSIVAAYGGYSYGVPNEYEPSDFRVSRGDRYWEQPFSGAHSDVGGGYDDGGSNLDALWWMYGVGASRGVPWDYSRFSPKQKLADYHAYETMHDSRYTLLDRVPWTDVGRESRVIFSGNLTP